MITDKWGAVSFRSEQFSWMRNGGVFDDISPKRDLALLVIAIGALAFALRPAITALPPIFPELRLYGFSSAELALLAAIPVVCFAIFSCTASVIGRRVGDERTILVCTFAIATFLYIRGLGGAIGLLLGTVIVSAAIAIVSTLLPGLIKRRSPTHTARLLAVYLALLYIGAATGSALSVPVFQFFGSLESAISAWSITALAAFIFWIPQVRLESPKNHTRRVPSTAVLANPLAWQVTGFMGFQSLIYYATISWLPTLLRGRGLSASSAGELVALLSLGGLVAAWVVPIAAERKGRQWIIVIVTSAAAASAILGASFAPLPTASMWCILLGFAQGASLALAFHFMIARAATPEIASAVSAMSQGLGYAIAACGPFLVAILNDATDGWRIPVVALLAVIGAQTVCGLLAARHQLIGDEGVSMDLTPKCSQRTSVLLLGVPGSGKTTLARILSSQYGAKHFAASQVLRQRAATSAPIAQKWKTFWARGENAPDSEVLPILWREFTSIEEGIVVLDGYPRTVTQLNDFYQRGGIVTLAIYLSIDPDAALRRAVRFREDRGVRVTDSIEKARIAREANELAKILADDRLKGITDTFDAEAIEPQEIAGVVMAELPDR